jgi:hypothetical protein
VLWGFFVGYDEVCGGGGVGCNAVKVAQTLKLRLDPQRRHYLVV